MKTRFFLTLVLMSAAWSTPGRAQTYEETRRQNDATPIASISNLRANLKALNGRAVELQGEVTGVMTQGGGRVVLFKIGEEMAILGAAPALESSHLLRVGTWARLLARVQDDGKTGVFTIIAASEADGAAAPAPASKSPADGKTQGDDAVQILASINNGGGSTPMTASVESLPQPPVAPSRAVVKPAAAKPKSGASAKVAPAKIVREKVSAGEMEEIIEAQVPAYSAIVRRHNKKLKPEVVYEISVAMLRAGFKYNMDPRFLAAIIAVESDFDVYCLSSSGAMGLGQLMPFNLREAGVKNAWNPTENIMGCAKLLRGHLDDYRNRSNGTLLAVAAYNAGPGAVRRAGYKVPNGKQVQRYVWKVYYRYKAFAPDMFK